MNPTERTIGTRTVSGETFDVVQGVWPDGGITYDVYVYHDHGLSCLTDAESLDHVPDNAEIQTLLEEWN